MIGNSFDNPFSVSQLTKQVRNKLEDNFQCLWIAGEISSFKKPASGHVYFTLKDENSQLQCVLYRLYTGVIPFEFELGLKVVVFGSISVYEKAGSYQLIAAQIEERGVGTLHASFERLKKELSGKGWFDRKRRIPSFPGCIGVVTSPTGAAVRDFISVSERRSKGLKILICPVRVQGETAAEEIKLAIAELNKIKEVEVIVVCRGGGSIEDLWPFNERKVAEAVFFSDKPVVSAVGHEIDFTICDFVADLRAPTPSAAAEMIIPDRSEIAEKIRSYGMRMKKCLQSYVEIKKETLKNMSKNRIFASPSDFICQYRQGMDDYYDIISRTVFHKVEVLKQGVKGYKSRLEALNPRNVLKRGFSLTINAGTSKIIRDAGEIGVNEEIVTQLFKGRIVSKVVHKETGENERENKI
ncbi:MAG: exodeoxyribonuclease VII large subunit [Candidatus Aureabacteria bacterium]|nr:exodeoxyribonuclease VII large subunit [Candidatus Auribacterota bacterium]